MSRAIGPGAATGLPLSTPTPDAFPPAVEMILSALDVAVRSAGDEKRLRSRRRYRVRAALRLYSDPDEAPAWILYTRDVNARGLGFVTPHLLPLGYGGVLQVPLPGLPALAIGCTLLRCRSVADGWYEGSLSFNRDRPEFGC